LKTTTHLCWVTFVKYARQQGALKHIKFEVICRVKQVKVKFTLEQAMKVQGGVEF